MGVVYLAIGLIVAAAISEWWAMRDRRRERRQAERLVAMRMPSGRLIMGTEREVRELAPPGPVLRTADDLIRDVLERTR